MPQYVHNGSYYSCYCYMFKGKTKVRRDASVPANSKADALRRFFRNYPAPRYFGHRCDNLDGSPK